MKKILVLPIFMVLVLAMSFSVHQVYAISSITLSSASGSVGSIVKISGTNFTPGSVVYIFFDHTIKDSVTVASDGSIHITVPVVQTTLGAHTISVSDSPITVNSITFAPFTVTPKVSIPEFPFSFGLVIIFVAISAVYLSIRQKMIPGFN
ncbi:MAG TPA: hypothetical protein VEU72_00885 [Nitrosopumilaceae archaeon]|nr:hypothetical protein [Nitrosopumilaceae archaeon]